MTGVTLIIKGERKPPADVKAEEYQCCEVCYGSFSRSITLPSAVDTNKTEAVYADGILELHLPKVKEAIPARIRIKAKQVRFACLLTRSASRQFEAGR